MTSRARKIRRRLRDAALGGLLRTLAGLVSRLSWGTVESLGRALGRLGWQLARRDRRRTREHLAHAYPELAASERERIAHASFLHHGTTLAEALHLSRKGCDEVLAHLRFEGWEHIEALQREGRPILILTGHCGNWELLAAGLSCRGLPLSVVARSLDDRGLQALLAGLRARFGTETIERGSPRAARQLLQVFRQGRALGMLIDQDTRVDGVWVPFFGRAAYTPVGAAKIALRQGAAVVPVFVERLEDGSHRARVEAPLPLPDDPQAATAAMTQTIEAQVRRRPEQWVWMHRRWRRQPPG